MKTLVLGGTRFVGKSLVSRLAANGHNLTLFTRGNRAVPDNVEHLKGDRKSTNDLKILKNRRFDVIIDISGRELEDTQEIIANTGFPTHRFVYVSSAGVYADSNILPHDEHSLIDPNSRHFGKVKTEKWLANEGIPFTVFRPTYIYGAGNYNPIEKWFFDRIINNRPVPIPGNGSWITQLGHVSDLAEAMSISIERKAANNKIYNCSGSKGSTFLGVVEAAAYACGKNIDQINICFFNPASLDPKARKNFPLRIGHFLTDITRIERDLDWKPKYTLLEGFKDSYDNDYLLNQSDSIDFSSDQILLDSSYN